jgi:hypothetical protein
MTHRATLNISGILLIFLQKEKGNHLNSAITFNIT